jgi:catechol 2,3-dioxygenase-like lactoylglutathione lyase family enzyme
MLNDSKLIAFVAVTDIDRAMHFYSDTLGLPVVDCTGEYCVLDANGTTLRLTLVVDRPPLHYTVVGWRVDDVSAKAGQLAERGVGFQRYDGVEQDHLGIWRAPNGDQIAWFHDPDGNILSLTQFF